VTVLSAPATEAPFPAWYLSVVAPLLDRLGLPRLFAKLLAGAACEVADQVPLTRELAASRPLPFPETALEVFEEIKLFLDAPECVYIVALDREAIRRGLAIRYREAGASAAIVAAIEEE
jgi:hypothetical protein